MPCTTILVGKKASFDGSTIISRNDDGAFEAKHIISISPKDQPKKYKCVISHLEIDLPDKALKYNTCPSVSPKNGLWPACGINEKNVGMSATETITSNPRVYAADPLVEYVAKDEKNPDSKEIPGGIGEEDLVTLVLPYISSAREGVIRLGELLEKYGTYERNGIAFNDENEVWWLETIGGHHFIAKRVEDDEVVIMPNQFGLDNFDFNDAYGKQQNCICSKDLKEFVINNNLDLGFGDTFNPRLAFGSRSDQDHIYNTPRAWYLARYFMPRRFKWDGDNADFTPESDDLPWSFKPEKKVTLEDIKYLLSSFYQGTPYNPYGHSDVKGKYRSIGVPNTDVCGIMQIRGYMPEPLKGVEWLSFGGGAFTATFPLYASVDSFPAYFSECSLDVSTDAIYWQSRLIAALTDAQFSTAIIFNERYVASVLNKTRKILVEYDNKMKETQDFSLMKEANEKIAEVVKKESNSVLSILLKNASEKMKTRFNRNDN